MEEFIKITKKEAIAILESKSNYLIASIWKPLELVKKLIIDKYEVVNNSINDNKCVFRKCVKKQSNALLFENSSWLYFSDIKQCFLFGEWLILTNTDITMLYRIK